MESRCQDGKLTSSEDKDKGRKDKSREKDIQGQVPSRRNTAVEEGGVVEVTTKAALSRQERK